MFGGPKATTVTLKARFFRERNPLKEWPLNVSIGTIVSCKIRTKAWKEGFFLESMKH